MTLSTAGYDLAGRQAFSAGPLANTNWFTEGFTAQGQFARTNTLPNGATRIEIFDSDGFLSRSLGTAVFPARYERGYDGDGFYTREIKLDANGNDTAEWTKTYTDFLGRSWKTVYPYGAGTAAALSEFNAKGQLTRRVDPDGGATLYLYNDAGELEYTIADLYQDGLPHKDGTNRVTQVVSDVINNTALGAVVHRQRTFVWPTDNQDASVLLSVTERSVDGLKSWHTTYADGRALTNRTVIVPTPSTGYRYVTNTASDGSYTKSVFRYGRLLSVTAYKVQVQYIGNTNGSEHR